MAAPEQDPQPVNGKREPHRSPEGTYEPVLKAVMEDLATLTDVEFRFLIYLAAKPPGWKFYTSHLARTTRWGERSVRRLFAALESKGFLTKECVRDSAGTFGEFFYLLRRNQVLATPADSKSRTSEPVVTERPMELTCEDVSLPRSEPVAMTATSGAGGRIENTDLPLSENSLKDQSEPRARGDCFTDLFWLPSVEIDPHRVALRTPAPMPSAARTETPRAAPPPAGDYGDLFAGPFPLADSEPAPAAAPEPPAPAIPAPAVPVREAVTEADMAAVGRLIMAEAAAAATPSPGSGYTPPPPEDQRKARLAAEGSRLVLPELQPAMSVTPAPAEPVFATPLEAGDATASPAATPGAATS